MRAGDNSYGQEYWQEMDGGAGCVDSTLWEDIAHILKEVFCIGPDGDRSGAVRSCDVGCAMGFLVRHLRRRGLDCWGLDISDYAVNSAPSDVAGYLRWYDLAWVDDSYFGRDAFDLVTCFETLEHVDAEHAGRAMGNIWNMLKPGGMAVLAICLEGREGADADPTHVNVVSRAWWQEMFDSAGWITEKDYLRRLQGFWLFRESDGAFVLSKPTNIGIRQNK